VFGSPAPVILIAGPTASGKSALAARLALATGGEIVNADSMQVYRDLRVLTARPTPAEEALAPHHLFGIADATQAWSVGHWLRAATATLTEIAARGRAAIVVGGTGLYFRALTRGLVEMPETPEGLRDAVARTLAAMGEPAFRRALAAVDPAAEARINAGDRQRLVRARAVFDATGRSLSDWRDATAPVLASGTWTGVVLAPPREALYRRCDERLPAMLADGALGEVAALMARRLDPGLPIMKALGVSAFSAQLRGELSAAEALDLVRRDTRRYAKRQSTWLRHQAPDWPKIEAIDPEDQWAELRHWVFHAPPAALTPLGRDGMS
jgi:tRNA dimethylallyltransferase